MNRENTKRRTKTIKVEKEKNQRLTNNLKTHIEQGKDLSKKTLAKNGGKGKG